MALAQYTEDSPAGKILTYLRRNGEATIRDLEELLGISTTAVREGGPELAIELEEKGYDFLREEVASA